MLNVWDGTPGFVMIEGEGEELCVFKILIFLNENLNTQFSPHPLAITKPGVPYQAFSRKQLSFKLQRKVISKANASESQLPTPSESEELPIVFLGKIKRIGLILANEYCLEANLMPRYKIPVKAWMCICGGASNCTQSSGLPNKTKQEQILKEEHQGYKLFLKVLKKRP